MRNSSKLPILLILANLGISCSKAEEKIDRRRGTPYEGIGNNIDSETHSDKDVAVGDELAFAGFELIEAKNQELLEPNFISDLQLISKVTNSAIVLFGKEGRSWLYNPAENAPPALQEPVVVSPEGSTLYTLPDGKFWMVSRDEIGKRKSGSVDDAGTVVIERFGTSSFNGNKDKIQVLYAAADALILHLETHLIILTTEADKPSFNQFVLDSLPVNLGGPVIAAGQGSNKSFWVASKETFALLEPRGSGFAWTKIKVPMDGQQDYKYLGLWLNPAQKAATGDVLLLNGEKLHSVSGAPVAATAE